MRPANTQHVEYEPAINDVKELLIMFQKQHARLDMCLPFKLPPPISWNVHFLQFPSFHSKDLSRQSHEIEIQFCERITAAAKTYKIETRDTSINTLVSSLLTMSAHYLLYSLCTDKIVYPFTMNSSAGDKDAISMQGGVTIFLKRLKAVSGFATTQHKWKVDGIYVAFSHTSNSSNLFKFPPKNENSFDYLYDLKRDPQMVKWVIKNLQQADNSPLSIPEWLNSTISDKSYLKRKASTSEISESVSKPKAAKLLVSKPKVTNMPASKPNVKKTSVSKPSTENKSFRSKH
ncbi:hypothetical protein HDU77_011006 [Chytriomyces hyalinus]|nr:hypothetical protein HDU77_011006 [Chytriomyces hyalinus]